MPIVTAQAPLSTTSPVAPTELPDLTPELVAPETPKAEEALSPRFAALAREQKILRQRQQALKAQEDAWLKKQSEYESNYIPKDKIKADGVSVLLENGYTMDQIAQILLNNNSPKDPAMVKMEQKILDLEQKAQEPIKRFEEIQAKQREQAINNVRNDVKLLVDSDENFETIKEMDAQEAVVDLIIKVFDETGDLLTTADASKQIEEKLLERALKFAALKKVQSKLSAPLAEAQKQQQLKTAATPTTQNQIRTLTNGATAAPSKPKTAAERIARAKAAFYGQQLT